MASISSPASVHNRTLAKNRVGGSPQTEPPKTVDPEHDCLIDEMVPEVQP